MTSHHSWRMPLSGKTVSIADIAYALGKHRSTVSKRAKDEKWQFAADPNSKLNRKLFLFDKLPDDVQKALGESLNEQGDRTEQQVEETVQQDTTEEVPPNTPQEEIPCNSEQPIDQPAPRFFLTASKQKELDLLLNKAKDRNIVILGKSGIGKTYLLDILAQKLSPEYKVILFKEPPTAKTILLNVLLAAGLEYGKSKESSIDQLSEYQGNHIIVCIDQLEKITPSAVSVLDSLMTKFTWFRFIGAGHLGGKKRYNATWMKAHAHFLKPLSRNESLELIDHVWPEGDRSLKKTIIDESRGIPGNISRMAKEAKQGIMPHEEEKYLDGTPFILIIATLGLTIRVIGYGYQSTESYIIGGVIGSVFWGVFWIYRGYVAGWWGSKYKNQKRHA
jgi:hypothetical protein